MKALLAFVLVPLSGCVAAGAACDPPLDADASREPYDNGVILYTVREGATVSAWACNESGNDRWLIERHGDCPGSWSWTYTSPQDDVPGAGWPPETNYGACEKWQRITDERALTKTFTLDVPYETGGEWRIRLQVYTQPRIIQDAGGGPVHAIYVL